MHAANLPEIYVITFFMHLFQFLNHITPNILYNLHFYTLYQCQIIVSVPVDLVLPIFVL